jgi:hypothetical protein
MDAPLTGIVGPLGLSAARGDQMRRGQHGSRGHVDDRDIELIAAGDRNDVDGDRVMVRLPLVRRRLGGESSDEKKESEGGAHVLILGWRRRPARLPSTAHAARETASLDSTHSVSP